MKGWEYKVLQLPGSDPALDEELLNVHGSKGWELQGVVLGSDGFRVCYLKRVSTHVAVEGEITMSMRAVPSDATTNVGKKPDGKSKRK